ncbi:MAG: RagB/SusD family nutrient uptake outer membrane protein [Bacteroidales bacterium]|nr:RagB/SusD family nutrient uptake outer membrane protein [Bacteroidales bacterium]MBN2749534.1 RagB/SusD family nutrient uptake outer membrane protein [Bacteroidales bacterium]
MRRILFAISSCALLLVVSCDSYLDFEPQQSQDYDKIFIDEEGVRSALDGAYSFLGSRDFYAGTSIFYSDVLGENGSRLTWTGTFIGYKNMFAKTLDPNEGTISSKWITAYRTINLCNNILSNLNLVSEGNRPNIEGEARFLRGILYFELVRFYSQPYGYTADNSHAGVPMLSSPVVKYEDIVFPARESVDDVYDQIIADLVAAKNLLEEGRAGSNRGLATSTVASAFLSRVYLSMKDWGQAAAEATTVINQFEGASALNVTPRAAYNNTGYTTEDVFMVRQNLTSHAGASNDGVGTFFASLPGFGRGDVQISANFLASFEATDLRGVLQDNPQAKTIGDITAMFYVGNGTRAGRIRSSKWGRFDAFINVIRIPEMYLSRAEANFMNGTSIGDEPYNDLNVIRARAKASLLASGADVTLDVIKSDRIKELCFEGHLLHDLKRWGDDINASHAWNSDALVLPIPQRELDVDKSGLLKQNQGY